MDRSNAYFSLLPSASLEHLDVDLSRVNHLDFVARTGSHLAHAARRAESRPRTPLARITLDLVA
jgi:hypothetical protein